MLQATTANWNQGDLDGFIAPYADATAFMTPAGPIGKDAMRARYQSRYFTGSRPDQQLRFEQLRVQATRRGTRVDDGPLCIERGREGRAVGMVHADLDADHERLAHHPRPQQLRSTTGVSRAHRHA